ncbi:amino acid transporter [Yamadazyma tenuis]|uniref:General amino acid permease AGP1 n=1 Tax=Candida tenuis (strain ATCC 10573 / BCRC 21748 / CBS 615 / JCM 9827 / NBRC 10315 / NRRL Y-1498 / VKM Y-70) TaxID=590646 RepID=G3BBA4_CANTC|nr:general amino acid permease AGP1 [Yamadazyma tenuis ATCC 10573]EGV61530.1 general amino acid permease AGP1 [Yamadazyma tenuis ATCC 10573]WEJ92752.1 amino acid transporter [Yamadazyma tenuis]
MEPTQTKENKTGPTYLSSNDDTLAVSFDSKTGHSSADSSMSRWQSFKYSFQRAEPGDVPPPKPISKRHLNLMALSTGLGTGLLVASGEKLRNAGPLFLLVAYAIVGYLMLIPTIYSAGELSVAYSNLQGGFQSYYSKFIDDSAAFALGWNYMIQWMSVVSLELVTASMTVKYWTDINSDVFVAIFLTVVILINLAGAKGYAEAEFIMNSTKLVMLTGFIIFGLVVDLGGTSHGFVGGKYWRHPGAYTNFKGLCSVFVASAFSLGGTEFISLSIADQANPRKAMSSACRLVFFRITVFFLGSLVFVGLLVPYTSDQLMGSGGAQTNASPFVIAAQTYTHVLSHVINSVILVSVTSVATSAMYSSPRLLLSLAKQGLAPKYFDYVDKAGRPFRGWVVTVIASFFSFIATYSDQDAVFTWLLSISALSFVFVWPAICVCQIRFRKALKLQGISLSSLGYVSPTGVIGSYSSIVINALILVAQFWVALFPIGGDGKPDVNAFFQNYLGVVFMVVFYFGHKIWTWNWQFLIPLDQIDINADRTIYDEEIMELERNEEKERFRHSPWYKKAVMWMFSL